MNYHEEIARWRQQRQQDEQAQRLQDIRVEHAQAVRERDQAIANNDLETAELRDNDAMYYEQEWRQFAPPPDDKFKREFMHLLTPWMEKNPQRATELLGLAHNRVTQPRVRFPTPANPGGMGIRENTRAYWEAMRNNLELYAGEVGGMPFDRAQELPHWKDIAQASGLSEKDYANAYHAMKRAGRIS